MLEAPAATYAARAPSLQKPVRPARGRRTPRSAAKARPEAPAPSAGAVTDGPRAAAAAECPPGLRLVGAEEKARILDKLAEERAKATLELRQLPFVVKTTSTQLKKDRLEARLEEIQGAEEAYMKERVFVPADM